MKIRTILPKLELSPDQAHSLQFMLDSIAEYFEEAKTEKLNVTGLLHGALSSLYERLLRVIAENKLSEDTFDDALTKIGQAFPITPDTLGYWSKYGSFLIDADNKLPALIDLKSKKLIASVAKFETRPSDEQLTQEVASLAIPQYNLVSTRVKKLFPPKVPLVAPLNSDSPISIEKIEEHAILREISQNPELSDLLKSKKYFVALTQDEDLPALIRSIQEKISSFSAEVPESIFGLTELFALLHKKILSSVEKLTVEYDRDDLVRCIGVLKQCLPYLNIAQSTDIKNIDSFAAFLSALSHYININVEDKPFLDLLLKDSNDRKYLSYQKHRTLLFERACRYQKDFPLFLSLFCGGAVASAVQNSQQKIDPNSEQVKNAKIALAKFLTEDIFLRNIAQHTIDNNKALEKIETVKPKLHKRARSLPDLMLYAKGQDQLEPLPLSRRSKVEQINFSYEVDLAKYTLTGREIELLSKATGIKLGGMIPIADKRNPESPTMTYDKALKLIEAKITKRERANSSLWRRILWSKNVKHLKAAHNYIKHHQEKYLSLKDPNYKPKLTSQAEKQPRPLEKWSIRFSRFAKNLWSFFDKPQNKAIKDLAVFAREKKKITKRLKLDAPIWQTFDPKNATPQKLSDLKSREVKTAEGSVWIPGTFFRPKSFRDSFFCQKLDSVANYFFPNENSIDDAKKLVLQIQSLEDKAEKANLQSLRNVSLMDATRAALYNVTDSLQKIDLAIDESVNVAQVEQRSRQLGWEAVMTVNRLNAKSAKQALTQAITPLLRCSVALEQLNATASKILTSVLNSCGESGNYQQALEKVQDEFSKIVEEPRERSMKEWQPEFINFLKNRDTRDLLLKIIKSLQPENDDDARKANVKIITDHIARLNENNEELKKVKEVYNPDNMGELLKTAKENARAVKYFSERAASPSLGG